MNDYKVFVDLIIAAWYGLCFVVGMHSLGEGIAKTLYITIQKGRGY